MAKLKPLPKALIVAAVIGGVGYAAMQLMPKKTDAPPENRVESTPVPAAPAPAPAPVAATPPPAPAPAKVELPAVTAAITQAQGTAPPATPEPQLVAGPNGKYPGAGIASGQKTGTNWPMVEDIRRTCSNDAYPLRNVITNGTLDNINLVYSNPNSQFGVAQVDGLIAQRKVDKRKMDRINAVFPFFSVEVHAVVANGSPINSLDDMAGKRVVEGPEGSGTNITVQLIKEATGIQWQTVPGNLSQADGLKAVLTGQADVEFIVAGQPISVLNSATGIKLVSLNHPKVDATGFYKKTQIPTGAYPWNANSVTTYQVDNAIVTFAYKNEYQKEIGDLVTCITHNIGALQANGHPKWRDVDPLDIERLKWPTHPAAVAAIRRELKK